MEDNNRSANTKRRSQGEKADTNVIKTVIIIDYVQKAQLTGRQSNMESVHSCFPLNSRIKGLGALAIDPRDGRINQHTLQNGVKWKRFPVTYYVDPSSIATLTLKAGSITDAVKKVFQGYDDQVTYTLFAHTPPQAPQR
jgi:hypothetical protein